MNPTTPSERAVATIAAWKSKLLDLSKRNRALNFKINKVSTVTVIDEIPAEIYRLLCNKKTPLKFKPTDIPDDEEGDSPEVESLFDEVDTRTSVQNEIDQISLFTPYSTEDLTAAHLDDFLQTNSSSEKLDKSLRRIEEQARSIIEEQGVNALFLALGMLHYREREDSEIFFRAPLVLVPVELVRRSAREGYTVKTTDEEIIVNPSLAEYLQHDFTISLPEVDTSDENYNLQDFYQQITEAVAVQTGWKITNEIYLGLFFFQKLVMYKDLEKNAAKVVEHKICNQIINREGENFIGLPDEIRDLNLDKNFPPESGSQVVEADSSQLRAIAAVAKNYDLVLEGPPGTGKSQTITNLIAQTLSTGKSVLFVAEKMAALEVVYRRLHEVGLGEFCLELHSTKANKKNVMQDLKNTLNASMQSIHPSHIATERLPVVRELLTDYINAVHKPYGVLNCSPFRAYGELEKVLGAQKQLFQTDISAISATNLADILRTIDDFTAAAEFVGDPKSHPWRETTKTFYSENNLDEIKWIGTAIVEKTNVLMVEAEKLESILGLPRLQTLADIETASTVASTIAQSPGAPSQILASEAWNETPPAEAVELIKKGRQVTKLRERAALVQVLNSDSYQNLAAQAEELINIGRKINNLRNKVLGTEIFTKKIYADSVKQASELVETGRSVIELRSNAENNFNATAFENDPTDDINYIEQKTSGFFSFLSFLDSRYRSIKKKWFAYRLPTYQEKLIQQAAGMREVADWWQKRRRCLAETPLGRQFFGSLWQDLDSNWNALEHFVFWVSSLRKISFQPNTPTSATDVSVLEKKAAEINLILNEHSKINGLSQDFVETWDATLRDWKLVVQLFNEKGNLAKQDSLGSAIFGSLWEGEDSNWDALERYVSWMNSFRELCEESNLQPHNSVIPRELPESLNELALLERKAFDMRSALIEYQGTKALSANYLNLWEAVEKDFLAVAEYLRERQKLDELNRSGLELFGLHWIGEMSDWSGLESYVSWVLEFRRVYRQFGLSESAISTAVSPRPDTAFIHALRQLSLELTQLLQKVISMVAWPNNYFENATAEKIVARVSELVANSDLAPRWASFESVRGKIAVSFAKEILDWVWSNQISFNDLSSVFRRSFYQKWITQVVSERPQLREFHALTHEKRIKEFQDLDEKILRQNQLNLVGQMRTQLQQNLQQPLIREQMNILRRELSRQRGLAPLRITMQRCLNVVNAIKPCFMMSPQTVAQLLDAEKARFDLVIFDEASQLPTEDSVGAVIRGKQLVVVGDPKQLPPTNFFAVASGQVNLQTDEDGIPLFDDSQSILEEMMGSGVPSSRLKWHYRSSHESLITFSNVSFYESDLYTFPSVETEAFDSGLQFEFVPEGIYEGKGLNVAEARRVANAVVRHAKEHPDVSIGVGTFNLRQQLAIQDELEQRRREDPNLEPFFNRGKKEPFFVKNLENIQGDERDVIFLSVTYAKAHDGKLRYNFGPLNGENGWRRMNVLTTRARKHMRVFSSIRSEDINLAATASRGAKLLRDFLGYAEYKRLDNPIVSAINETDSPFEREVFQELSRRGVSLIPQVGASGYKIDFGVTDSSISGKFVCGIECDGVAYHSSQTARDRDRLRQQVLEGRGWDIHRIWSTDWFKDRSGQIERLLGLIDKSLQRAKIDSEEEAERRDFRESEIKREALDILGVVETTGTVANLEDLEPSSYVRPTAIQYQITTFNLPSHFQSLLDAPVQEIAKVILTIVENEAPIHIKDVFTRAASAWGQKSGSNISLRIEEILKLLKQAGHVERRNDFVWKMGRAVTVRSRDIISIPAERIAPEEIQEGILLVLRDGHKFDRPVLINEVRTVLGFSRTGGSLQQVIGHAIDNLLATGILGEGSIGIGLRK